MICSSCGFNNPDDQRSCSVCGTPLGAAAVSADSVPPPAAPASLPYPTPSIPTIAPPDAQYPYGAPPSTTTAPPNAQYPYGAPTTYGVYPYPPQPPQKKKMQIGILALIIIASVLIVALLAYVLVTQLGLFKSSDPIDPDPPISDPIDPDPSGNFANGAGNTNGNLVNSGYAVVYQDWIYFSNRSDYDYIYKMRTDGSEQTLVYADDSFFLNIVDDWIYYYQYFDESINKVKTDGTQWSVVLYEQIDSLTYSNGWLYFVEENNQGAIYKIRPDGTAKTKVGGSSVRQMNIVGDWIYFLDDENYICKIKTDGTEYKLLCSDRVLSLVLNDDRLYYVNGDDDYAIYSMNLDGSDQTLLVNDVDAAHINVADGWIYFVSDNHGGSIWRARLDGSEAAQINDKDCICINIVGNQIIYLGADGDTYIMYVMMLDGSDNRII